MGTAGAGRVALITGASRGIGKALAIRLAAEGAAVAVTARSLHAERFGCCLRGTEEMCEELGAKAMAIEADLADPDADLEAIVADVEETLGPVDILINNAAMGGYRGFAEWSDAELRAIQEVNVWAPWRLSRRVVPGMRERGRGWILNISSAAAELLHGPPYQGMVAVRGGIYGGTKAMLNRWTASLAAELHGTGVAANALSPQAATATEGVLLSIQTGRIPRDLTEPLATWSRRLWPSSPVTRRR